MFDDYKLINKLIKELETDIDNLKIKNSNLQEINKESDNKNYNLLNDIKLLNDNLENKNI
jgi:hypothetical protein